jgi:hypothetical protein
MDQIRKLKQYIITNSPGYEKEIDTDKTYTTRMLFARRRVGFSRMMAPGIHIEAEDYIWDKRLKGGFFRHFRYFGPRGEILFYFFLVLATARFFRNNLSRAEEIESVMNDRNVYLKLNLDYEHRKIEPKTKETKVHGH